MALERPMRLLRFAAYLSIILGFILLGWGVLSGEIQFALFIVFPVIYGQGLLGAGGILLIFLGFILFFFSFAQPMPREQAERKTDEEGYQRTKREFGGVVFIGPIPIVFGSGKELLRNRWFLAAIIAIAIIMLLLTLAAILL